MASFWAQLKRRNVVKVAVAYAIVGWLPAVSFVSTSSMAGEYGDVVIADAHIHLLDFLQNGDYLENGKIVQKVPGAALPAGQRGKRIEAVLWAMDRANVSHALVTGMPFLKKWSEDEPVRPAYYLDATSRVVRARDTDYHVALAIEDFKREGGDTALRQLKHLYPCVSGFDGTDLGAVDINRRMFARSDRYPLENLPKA